MKNVHLFAGGIADKLVSKYSGGMKRRLSVAISLIGDPKVQFIYVKFREILNILAYINHAF